MILYLDITDLLVLDYENDDVCSSSPQCMGFVCDACLEEEVICFGDVHKRWYSTKQKILDKLCKLKVNSESDAEK